MQPKDFLNKELNIGDKVVYVHKYYKMASELRKGVIKRFTAQKAEINGKLTFFNTIIKI